MQNNTEQGSGNNQIPDWLTSALGMGTGLGQAANGAFNLFGNQTNPATGANNTVGQIPGQVEQYYSPYMDAGKGALSDLQNQNKDLLSGNIQNKLGESYKESPGYQFKLKQAMEQANRAAAAGGMLGSGAHQYNSMQTATGLADQDYDNYIKNQMGLYNTGYAGEQGLNNQGFDANKGMADTVGTSMAQQAAYDFMGQQGQNQAKSSGMKDLFTGLGTAGATALGGPAGGAGFQALMKLFGNQG